MFKYSISEEHSRGSTTFYVSISTDNKRLFSEIDKLSKKCYYEDAGITEADLSDICVDKEGYYVCCNCNGRLSNGKELFVYCPRCGRKADYTLFRRD